MHFFDVLSSIPGEGGPLKPPFRFSCAMAKRRKIFSSYLVTFPQYSLSTFQQKIINPGQVRSGHQSGVLDPTSEKFTITSELEFFTEPFPSFRYLLRCQYVYFISESVYIYVTWGQVRVATSLWKNNATCPASSKRVKTTQLFQDYDRLPDQSWPRWHSLTGTPEGSSEVLWGHQ